MNVNTICSCGRLRNVKERCSCKNVRSKKEVERNSDLTTTKWKKFRKQILVRDNGHCQRCLLRFSILNTNYSEMQVHHIKPRVNYPELMYEATNCVTLCKQCNLELGTKETLDFEFEPQPLEFNYVL
jgi:5-methylcytosine-specific restriction endonuclease McrA